MSEVVAGRRRVSATTAFELAAVVLVLAVVGVLLAVATHLVGTVSSAIAVGTAFGVVGIVVAARQPRNPMGWILLGATAFLFLSVDASLYLILTYRMHRGTGALGAMAVFLQPTWAIAVVLTVLAVLLFPDGLLPSNRWKWVIRALFAAAALFQLGALIIGLGAVLGHNVHVTSGGDLTTIDDPTGGYRWWSYIENLYFVVLGLSVLAWLGRQVSSYLKLTGERRLQQKWLLCGAAIFVISVASSFVFSNSTSGIGAKISAVATIGFVALPVSLGVGILKFRLYDIDRLISRTLSYAIVTGLVVGAYVGVITLVTRVLGFSSPVAVAASTLAAVALFNPLRVRVQHVVDRRFNRAHYDAEATVAAFTARLRDAVDLDTVRSELLEVVNRAVEPAHASVWIRRRE